MKLCKNAPKNECYEETSVAINPDRPVDPEEPITRRTVLETAIKTICEDRLDQYGDPENNFQTIADMWTTYLRAAEVISPTTDAVIMPHDVAAMMCMLKLARVATGAAKLDNWVDLAGYAALGGEMEQ
jgi:hypothetical protein